MMIEFKNIFRSYDNGKVQAVKALSLKVQQGEIFGFLGPNGAGKTTTIKMMTHLLKPDRGEIFFNGLNIQKESLKSKKITGYVPDEPVLYEKMRGNDFLSFIADMHEVETKKRDSISGLAEAFEMTGPLNDLISSYSHGMKQKIAILSALIHDPQIIILDEPIVGLDPKASFHLKEMLKAKAAEGKTVFFSTHVMEIAEKLCHRVGIIRKGELLVAETVEGLREMAGKKNASLERLFLEMTGEND